MMNPEKQETVELLKRLREASPSVLANFKLNGHGRFVPPEVIDLRDVELESKSSPIDSDEKTSAD